MKRGAAGGSKDGSGFDDAFAPSHSQVEAASLETMMRTTIGDLLLILAILMLVQVRHRALTSLRVLLRTTTITPILSPRI